MLFRRFFRFLISEIYIKYNEYLINGLFGLFLLYIWSHNMIIQISLAMDWWIPHKLVIGWDGISLTPISNPKSEPNSISIYILYIIIFMYHFLSYKYIISSWLRDILNDNKDSDFIFVFFKRIFSAFILFNLWHFFLLILVMTNIWGCGLHIVYVLGSNDVSLFPFDE